MARWPDNAFWSHIEQNMHINLFAAVFFVSPRVRIVWPGEQPGFCLSGGVKPKSKCFQKMFQSLVLWKPVQT